LPLLNECQWRFQHGSEPPPRFPHQDCKPPGVGVNANSRVNASFVNRIGICLRVGITDVDPLLVRAGRDAGFLVRSGLGPVIELRAASADVTSVIAGLLRRLLVHHLRDGRAVRTVLRLLTDQRSQLCAVGRPERVGREWLLQANAVRERPRQLVHHREREY
jgi:hypothetical protein